MAEYYSPTGLRRLAVLLLRQSHPQSIGEGYRVLDSCLGAYGFDRSGIDQAMSEYFAAHPELKAAA